MNTTERDQGFFARHAILRRSLAPLSIAILSTGCITWRSAVTRPNELMAQHPNQVRISVGHGARMVLFAPTVAGDDLLGYRQPDEVETRIAIPLRNVTLIEVGQVDGLRTAEYVGAMTLAGILLLAAAEWCARSRSRVWIRTARRDVWNGRADPEP